MAESCTNALLSDDEVKVIQSIWSSVMKDANTHGMNFFLKFFRENPTFQERFASLRNLKTEEEMKASKRLKAHAASVFHAITALVDNLDDLECVSDMLEKIAANHLRRKVNWPFFDRIALCIVAFLSETLGTQIMDSKATTAWTKVLNVITETVKRVEVEQLETQSASS
ncbi:globin [Tetranychus urticae]|uniref:Globin domain-containing protein n=1 Tax=Tetranychus urticae TaxID=32264 RepID=T1KR38_TETUR|nr:globin [Tetranychus urticae]